jgi:hypothetical protein
MQYPDLLGWKEGTTDRAAAQKAQPKALKNREVILAHLQKGDFSAEELAMLTGWEVYECRRRCSDLRALGKIKPVGKKKNINGNPEIVWGVL